MDPQFRWITFSRGCCWSGIGIKRDLFLFPQFFFPCLGSSFVWCLTVSDQERFFFFSFLLVWLENLTRQGEPTRRYTFLLTVSHEGLFLCSEFHDTQDEFTTRKWKHTLRCDSLILLTLLSQTTVSQAEKETRVLMMILDFSLVFFFFPSRRQRWHQFPRFVRKTETP
jgi:hypothetical protein